MGRCHASRFLGELKDWVWVVLYPRTHFEKQSAHLLISKDSILAGMLLIQNFHFFIGEFAGKPLQCLNKSSIINYPFIFHIEESESSFALLSFILFNVGFLPYFLKDGHFHLFEAVDGDSIVHQAISVNQNINKIFFPFNGNASIHIKVVLFEL